MKVCGRRFPIIVHSRTYYVTCALPPGHEHDCAGIAHDYGAPRL